MKLQLAIAQTMDLLEQRDPQHLSAGQSGAAGVRARRAHHVPMDELPDLRMLIQNLARRGERLGVCVRTPGGSECFGSRALPHPPQIGDSCGDSLTCNTASYTKQAHNRGAFAPISLYFS